uniref:Aminotransferase-like plant mobile domain-containing protein n=1 Tax=Nicotiana tabacum TaxID=4097 RepID=A0A1S3YGI2_TOBAC|nr:PREDICTED: uncharacterized protein LOC107776071 [Nicotiana tabacum]
MVDSSEDALIMEEREELMVSLVDYEQVIPIIRVAHFLKPTLPSAEKFPFSPSRPNIQELRRSTSLKVQFRGGVSVSHLKEWATWVNKLKPLYQEIWKKAGIFEAIIASTFKICMHNDLIIALAERWCLETNTFILPWGEATVTLEDMVVLSGYSVLGHCVLNPIKTQESVQTEKVLSEAFTVIAARKRNVYQHAWMEHFAGRGGHLEHIALLTLWLSRYVLPSKSYYKVDRALFPIAIHLSQGIPVAFAPAVLASIYRDLTLLKQFIISSFKHPEQSNYRCIEDTSDLILRAPLHIVQLWAWERFPSLLLKPSVINFGEPRVARWHKVKKARCVDPRSAIDSAAELFLWRPYAIDTVKNWDINKFYKEKEEYVVVGPNVGREILMFARLIRASELVGMDCVELYNPHRVSMQFGFDQDVPGCVNHAWRYYDRPIKDAKLYIPSRFFQSDVSKRYLEWWKNQKITPEDAVKHVIKGQQSKTHGRIPEMLWGHNEKLNALVCCECARKSYEVRTNGNIQDCEMRDVESSDDDDNLTISEFSRKRRLQKKGITVADNRELLPTTNCQSSSPWNDELTATEREALIESKPKKLETTNGKSEELDGNEAYVVKENMPQESMDKNDKGDCKLNLPGSEGLNANRSDGYAECSSTSLAKASVEASKRTANGINKTEGNMQIENIDNHEKGSSRYEKIDLDLLKLEKRIRNFENIIAGKVPRLRTR